MAETALALADQSLPKTAPESLTKGQAWGLVRKQYEQILDYRRSAGSDASGMARAGSAITDTAVSVFAGFAVPLALEAKPEFKKIGKGKLFVDTQFLLAAATLFGGGIMFSMGMEGGRAVLEAGKGIAASYAGIKAVELAKEWFGTTASTPTAPALAAVA